MFTMQKRSYDSDYASLCCWCRIIWKYRAVYFEKWNCVHCNVSEIISKIIIVSYSAVRLSKILSSNYIPRSCWPSVVNIERCENQLKSDICCAVLHRILCSVAPYSVQCCTVFCAVLHRILCTLVLNTPTVTVCLLSNKHVEKKIFISSKYSKNCEFGQLCKSATCCNCTHSYETGKVLLCYTW